MRDNRFEINNDDISMMFNATEVYVGAYDGAAWTTTRLTDNCVADMAPTVASSGSRAVVAWRSMSASSTMAADAATGALTIVSVGTAVVTVTAAETDTYAAASLDVTVTILQVPTVPGDIDGDGEVTPKDVTVLLRGITGGYGIELTQQIKDVNHDGRVNAKDVVLLMRFIAGGYGVTLV